MVQGIGHVGENLKHLVDDGALVVINDINELRLKEVAELYNCETIFGDELYDQKWISMPLCSWALL